MKTKPSNEQQAHQVLPAPRPQLTVRSDVRAGLSGDCALGVSYWRKELNSLRKIADALDCS
jgi:hypothetical protein